MGACINVKAHPAQQRKIGVYEMIEWRRPFHLGGLMGQSQRNGQRLQNEGRRTSTAAFRHLSNVEVI